MSNIAIHTENLGKRYRLGATVDFSRTFREALLGLPKYFYQLSKSKAQRLLDKTEYPKDTPKGTFWALRDINLDIRHGDVVGIIGRNGAGKSTLLKILSKITSPTTGIARINGRVGSLLEVGTGFHPELSGRENIYLNGSILGMRKAEIQKKFDEIVAFAEVEQFLDTPIKRYSSGMQVRLAFAVAAHLEPEILIVDEVLAVGDAAFQKKCLGKMEDVSKEGRTVLFVSHNMEAVTRLCKKGILLNKGKIELADESEKVINYYLNEIIDNQQENYNQNPSIKRESKIDTPGPKLLKVSLTNKDGTIQNIFSTHESITVILDVSSNNDTNKKYSVLWYLLDKSQQYVAVGSSALMGLQWYSYDKNTIKFIIYPEALIPGKYFMHLALHYPHTMVFDEWKDAITFEIIGEPNNENGFIYPGPWKVQFYLKHEWLG